LNSAQPDAPAPSQLEFALVVAADQQGGIGRNGDLPWQLPGDMSYFRKLTTGQGANAVIMGRKTWDSIPTRFRPLQNRLNVVLSRSQPDLPDGVLLAHSLEQALQQLATSNAERPLEHIFVIGGGKVYAEALARTHCRQVFLTRVEGNFDCDTFLPDLEPQWREVAHPCSSMAEIEAPSDTEIAFRFCCLERKP
jgi:dihydrofolate reductase